MFLALYLNLISCQNSDDDGLGLADMGPEFFVLPNVAAWTRFPFSCFLF